MAPAPSPLQDLLLKEIRLHGPISFARFQDLALYHPSWGYYAQGNAPGREGADFWTAPEIDPAFGELIGRQIIEMAGKLQEQGRFHVVEYGAGSGSLASALLDSWRREESALYRPGIYRIVEVSPALVEKQRQRLQEHGDVVSWVKEDSVSQVPVPGVVLMNEVLDALPVERVVGTSGGLSEVRVGEQSGLLAEVRVPVAPDLAAEVERLLPDNMHEVPDGHELEICRNLPGFLSRAASKISSGYLLIIDYGHSTLERLHPSRKRGTVMGYAGHRATESLLQNPGLQDLTAHVDLDQLASVARSTGFSTSAWTTQMKFLLALGLGEMIESLESMELSEGQRVSRRLAMASLVRPGGMGEMFKVFLAGRDAPLDLAGLQEPWA